MEIHTTTDHTVYRRALEVLAHNRYIVIEPSGNIVDSSVLQDGDTLLAEVVPEGVAVCDVCGFSVEHDVHGEEFITAGEAPEFGF